MISKNFFSNDLSLLRQILKGSKKKVFLVTGNKSFQDSGIKKKIEPFFKDHIVRRFSDFNVNPSIEDLKKGIKVFSNFNADIIIAIGGGSVIDMAKLINIISAQNENSIKNIIIGKTPIKRKGLELVAIPTTTGTGSEVTQFAVVYINNKKYSLDHKSILPDYYILDSNLVADLPAYVIACSAFDALSQAVESYWSIKSNEKSKKFSRKAIKLILNSIIPAVKKNNKDSINSLLKAANLAGKAINITRTTAPHALSYPLTKFYNIPHGHAVALTLGKFFIINASTNKKINDQRGKKYIDKTMNKIYSLFDCNNEFDCHDKWYRIMSEASLELDLRKLGLKSVSDIKKVVSNINIERLNNNPVAINKKDLENIFK